jgi:cytochrome c biogenesis protein CcmG/thiol:disulfide interchange protein DsbE
MDLIIGQKPGADGAAGPASADAMIVDGDQATFMKDVVEASRSIPVMVDFWATWCGPCKIETPWLVELRNQYASKGFEILGVSLDDLDTDDKKMLAQEKRDIAKFVAQEHMQYPVLIDGGSIDKPYGGLDALPTSYFVDRTGKVVATQLGLTSKDDIEGNIHKALGE